MTQQGDRKSRPPRRVSLQRLGGGSRHGPATHGGARGRRRGKADHDERYGGALRGQGKASRGGEVECLGRAPELDKDGAKRRAAQGLARRSQSACLISYAYQYRAAWIRTEGGETGSVKNASLGIDKILSDPNEGASTRYT